MCVCFSNAATMCSQNLFYFAAVLWGTMMVGSMCIYGAIPLFFEVVCESTYPIAEGITNGLLTWLNNVVGLVFLFVAMIPQLGELGNSWGILRGYCEKLPGPI